MRRLLIVLVAAAALAAVGVGYLWLAGGSGEPTTELTTPTLPPATDPAAATTTTDETPADTTSTTEADTTSTTEAAGTGELSFVIDAESSEASFELDEELRGSPKHVVGTTSEVAGQVRFDPADLSTAQISEIVINARTFQTDSANRDRAIRGPIILNSASDEFELITFSPGQIEGLPAEVAAGEAITFTVAGDLTIRDVTQEATFEVEATWDGDANLEGRAETVVDRTDFGIGIPNVASVANVSEEVLIALDFVAVRG